MSKQSLMLLLEEALREANESGYLLVGFVAPYPDKVCEEKLLMNFGNCHESDDPKMFKLLAEEYQAKKAKNGLNVIHVLRKA